MGQGTPWVDVDLATDELSNLMGSVVRHERDSNLVWATAVHYTWWRGRPWSPPPGSENEGEEVHNRTQSPDLGSEPAVSHIILIGLLAQGSPGLGERPAWSHSSKPSNVNLANVSRRVSPSSVPRYTCFRTNKKPLVEPV